MEGARDTGLKNVASTSSLKGMDDFDLSKLLHKPRLNIERQRSFDERSLSELSIGLAARAGVENLEAMNSPGGRSSYLDTPAPSSRNSFDPHAMVAEAWDALRRSLVYFRGHPVGTVAALDYTEEALNYERGGGTSSTPNIRRSIRTEYSNKTDISTSSSNLPGAYRCSSRNSRPRHNSGGICPYG